LVGRAGQQRHTALLAHPLNQLIKRVHEAFRRLPIPYLNRRLLSHLIHRMPLAAHAAGGFFWACESRSSR
jgi:hypothetical protein